MATFTYLGAFRLPAGSGDTTSLDYSEGRIAFNPLRNSLYISGHDWYQRIGEVTIPALKTGSLSGLNTASWLQTPVAVSSRIPQYTLEDTVKIGGMILDNQNRLIVTLYEYYDGDADAVRSHYVVTTPTNLTNSPVIGLCQVGANGGGYVGGYMAKVPDAYVAQIGKPYVTGMAGIAVTGRTSNGPALFGFDPADLSQSTIAQAVPLVYYPLTNPLRKEDTQNDYFNTSTAIRGVTFHGDEVVFWGTHGTGPWSYTQGGSTDPYRPGDNVHAPPYRYQRWTYKIADLLAVKAGTKQPWSIQPTVEGYAMPAYGDSSKYAGSTALDPATNRIFVAQRYGDTARPVIHVFQASGTVTPPADTTAPAIASVLAIPGETSCNISWTTDEASDSRVEYTETDFPGTVAINQSMVTSHVIELTGLQHSVTYNFRVKSRDAAGNAGISNAATFTTLTPPPSPCAELEAQVASMASQIATLQLQITSLQLAVANKDAQLLQANTDLSNALSEVARVNTLLSSALAETNSWHQAYDTLFDSVVAAKSFLNQAIAKLG